MVFKRKTIINPEPSKDEQQLPKGSEAYEPGLFRDQVQLTGLQENESYSRIFSTVFVF